MVRRNRRNSTKTSLFGSTKRISHDASYFYSRKMFEDLPQEEIVEYKENQITNSLLNSIINKSSEKMDEIPDNCIHILITSPPYNVGKDYDNDFSLEEYLSFLESIWRESYRVLVPGGRLCVNVANLGRKPYFPLHTYLYNQMIDLSFLPRGEVIWNKSASAGSSTAWGSWKSSSNPTLRDVHEYILFFSKQMYKRPQTKNKLNTISREEFLEYTKSIWSFTTESARNIGHPAPFPVELPLRCIQLFSYRDEIVLDPFMGSGQTAIAALKAERRFIGYEINSEYVELAYKRINDFLNQNRTI